MAQSFGKAVTVAVRGGALEGFAYGEGPTVFCLHGWLDNAASFIPLLPLLPAGNRYLALDLAGHGHSTHRPPGTSYHYWDYVADLLDAVETVGERPVTLLGHSLGGTVAAVFAATFPERVSRLVLLDSMGPLSGPPAEGLERLRRWLLASRKVNASPSARYQTLDDAIAARRRAGSLAESSARLLVERNAVETDEGVRWRSDRRLLLPSPSRLTEAQVMVFLEAVRCPTLVVRAVPGLAVPEADWQRRAAALPHAKAVAIAGDHHVHMDSPETVAQPVSDFLRAQ